MGRGQIISYALNTAGLLFLIKTIYEKKIFFLQQSTKIPEGGSAMAKQSKKRGAIPNVLIAGAQKSSTSSITVHLAYSYDACVSLDIEGSKGGGKEPHFFDNHFENGLPYYESVFSHCQDKNASLILDATPETMLFPERVRLTYEEHGTADKVKILFSLREPVSREISWYNHRVRDAALPDPPQYSKNLFREDGQISKFKGAVKREIIPSLITGRVNRHSYGMYVKWLERWIQVFDRKQILVLSYDELKQNSTRYLERIHEFLGIPVNKSLEIEKANTGGSKSEQPGCAVQKRLAALFEPYNEQLYDLLERHPGPPQEQRPFPKFHFECQT
jgi:hypothetical protein